VTNGLSNNPLTRELSNSLRPRIAALLTGDGLILSSSEMKAQGQPKLLHSHIAKRARASATLRDLLPDFKTSV
jgi:hypothetical protein